MIGQLDMHRDAVSGVAVPVCYGRPVLASASAAPVSSHNWGITAVQIILMRQEDSDARVSCGEHTAFDEVIRVEGSRSLKTRSRACIPPFLPTNFQILSPPSIAIHSRRRWLTARSPTGSVTDRSTVDDTGHHARFPRAPPRPAVDARSAVATCAAMLGQHATAAARLVIRRSVGWFVDWLPAACERRAVGQHPARRMRSLLG